jgi:NADPH-dependent curcumin reductase CurA
VKLAAVMQRSRGVLSVITSREIRLKKRLVGVPSADDFELATVPVPAPALGEVQVKNLWMSVDPYMRGRMVDRASYDPQPRLSEAVPAPEIGEVAASNSTMYGWRPAFQLGEAMQGGAIGEVVASEDPRFKPGNLVSSWFGWRERYNAPAGAVEILNTLGLPPQAFLGVAGVPGLTAWGGLLKIAAPRAGDVVFVSAAAGAVGSVACQIAKLKGHTVIGSAGGANKCAFLREIGVDHVIDYKATSNLTDALLRAAPNGIDVYFDNVGGNHLEAALAAANRFARFVLCGMISQYNTVGLPEGPRNIMFVIGKCIRLEGLDVANYFNLLSEFHQDVSGWIRDGKLVWKESVEHGIENAPTAFLKLFKGENFGKMLVKLA